MCESFPTLPGFLMGVCLSDDFDTIYAARFLGNARLAMPQRNALQISTRIEERGGLDSVILRSTTDIDAAPARPLMNDYNFLDADLHLLYPLVFCRTFGNLSDPSLLAAFKQAAGEIWTEPSGRQVVLLSCGSAEAVFTIRRSLVRLNDEQVPDDFFGYFGCSSAPKTGTRSRIARAGCKLKQGLRRGLFPYETRNGTVLGCLAGRSCDYRRTGERR